MKLKLTIVLVAFCLFKQICKAQGNIFQPQKIINLSETTDTTIFIYTTALWCRPCLDKMPTLDAYFKKTKQKIKIIYLFDNDGFSIAKAKKTFPHIDFSGKYLLIDDSLYPKGFIQVNPSNKMFKKLANIIKLSNTNAIGLDNLSLSNFIIFYPSKKIVVRDSPNVNGLKLFELEQLFTELSK